MMIYLDDSRESFFFVDFPSITKKEIKRVFFQSGVFYVWISMEGLIADVPCFKCQYKQYHMNLKFGLMFPRFSFLTLFKIFNLPR